MDDNFFSEPPIEFLLFFFIFVTMYDTYTETPISFAIEIQIRDEVNSCFWLQSFEFAGILRIAEQNEWKVVNFPMFWNNLAD